MSSIVVQTPPKAEPLTLAQVKLHCRIVNTDEDVLLGVYITAARDLVESESGRSLVNKVYRQSHDVFPHQHEGSGFGAAGYYYNAPRHTHRHRTDHLAIKLLRCPLVNVAKISYIGTDGASHDLFPTPEAWRALTEYEVGDQIAANGFLQQVTAVTESETGGSSDSGANTPTWNATLAGTTTDGDLTWTNKGTAPTGDFIMDRDSEPPRLLPLNLQVWPLTQHVPNAVDVFFTAGYGDDAADAPAALKVAMMQLVSTWYQNRESVSHLVINPIPDHTQTLIWSQRVVDFSPTR